MIIAALCADAVTSLALLGLMWFFYKKEEPLPLALVVWITATVLFAKLSLLVSQW